MERHRRRDLGPAGRPGGRPRAAPLPWSGRGITVAVLDTGYDAHHPDLDGRVALSHSFIPGETAQDGNGHGTHVAGTIGAVRHPSGGQRRYSVAPGCRLLVGKVLGNSGGGTSGGVLAGMNWAIEQGADVISMSLGSDTRVGDTYLRYYEAAGRAALDAGSIIVAAAGNNGDNPVGSPANCPSVLAVAAVDQHLRRAPFSSIALNGNGGEVNIAGPGVGIYSSWPVDAGSYQVLRGTSMATPHVSGIAALYAQATGLRGRELSEKLLGTATALAEGSQLVGRGLATAPTRPAAAKP
ncbi:S8 family serine peptidase [Serinibacter arcticus]|uniref:S8 family serine peptidase n=1 Tax=Serinibacter arcticus TaxID=1655435 RepID=UPI002E2740BB